MFIALAYVSNCVDRYDLLCIEGIARALRLYLGKDKATPYKIVLPPGGESKLLTTTIDPEVRASSAFSCHPY